MSYTLFGDRMNKLYMGIDIGAISTKGVIIDKYDNIIASAYLDTEGEPIKAIKRLIKMLRHEIDLDNYQIVSVGTTGRARKLIGALLEANVIKNEITAQAVGTIKLYPDVRTIIDIGGEDAKIILVHDGIVTDYGINTSCMAGEGNFLDMLFKQLNIDTEQIGKIAINSTNRVDISAKCMIFAKTDIIHKIQMGYKKEDILSGACRMVAMNYLNGVGKGKKIQAPIVFNGGVSKNIMVVKYFEELLGQKIIVNRNSRLMSAFGIAIMARESKKEKLFNFDIDADGLDTKLINCTKCSNNCEIMAIYKNNKMIDYWGNRCKHDVILKNV